MSEVREKIIMRVSLAENEVRKMSEMPNLEVWNGNYAHLDKKTNRVDLNIRTYVKNIDDNYGNSTAIGNVNVVFSVESFTDFVSDMTTRLEKIKAEVAEVSEVA